jgi:subtilase family serine protease
LGGAIFTEGGNVVVKNSTFTANFAVRGVAGGEGAHNGSDAGGAIFSLNGSTSVLNSTISGNEDTGSGGGIVILQFPPFPPTSLTLHNTIVANNGAQECAIAGLNPTVAASGNLIQNNVNCPGVVTSDDPQLGPLQLNSPGFTPTMAIPSTSPAFNTADGTTSLLTDQRGLKRPQGTGFDIGAFEKCTSRFEFQCLQFVIKQTDTEPLITQASPPAGGTVSPPSGDYDRNSVQHLVATPNPGYFFINWTGNVSDPNSPSSYVTMDQAQTVTANFATFKPDLIISALSSNATAITPGKTFLLSNTVTNQASGSAGSSVAAFHLSTNTTYGDGDDIPFTLTRTVGPLAAGASSSASNTLIVPATAPQGTYYICAKADSGNTVTETNESNNTLCTAGTIQITQPDLIMTDVAPNALTVNQGGTLSVDDTVLNQGSVPTPIGFRVGFHLSGNNIYGDGDDLVIITNRVVAALGAGASSAGTTGLLIPSTTPPGVYFVCAMADSLAQVAEADETNNTRCSSAQVTVPLPDLIISALSTATTTANAGGVAMVTNAIKNQGGSKAGTFVEAFHLSTNTTFGDGDDIVLTPTRTIGSLGIGATSTATNAVQIPDATPGGSYYICANSDDGDSVAESDETNNARCTATTITVPLPDLVMKSLFKSAGTVARGGSFAVTDTVKNQGGSAASGFAIGIVLSKNNVIGDVDDILLAPQQPVGGLGTGLNSSSLSTTVTVPGGTATGVYYVGAIADVNEAVTEGDEGNNTVLATGTITVTP